MAIWIWSLHCFNKAWLRRVVWTKQVVGELALHCKILGIKIAFPKSWSLFMCAIDAFIFKGHEYEKKRLNRQFTLDPGPLGSFEYEGSRQMQWVVLGESFAFSFLESWATPCQLKGLSFRTGFEGWNVAVKKYLANFNQITRVSTAFSTVMMDK